MVPASIRPQITAAHYHKPLPVNIQPESSSAEAKPVASAVDSTKPIRDQKPMPPVRINPKDDDADDSKKCYHPSKMKWFSRRKHFCKTAKEAVEQAQQDSATSSAGGCSIDPAQGGGVTGGIKPIKYPPILYASSADIMGVSDVASDQNSAAEVSSKLKIEA